MLLGVDVGGTFTDAALVRGDGSVATAKVATTPEDQSIGVLEAVAAVLSREHDAPVTRFAHGMTVATNAVLEGTTARTALLVTEGFTDVVELARQARPELYRPCAAPAPALVPPELRFAVPERMTPDGPLRTLSERDASALASQVAESGVASVAVVLLHSYAHPEHELLLGRTLAAALPDAHVTLSHQLVGTFREYERAATTELDAAISPLLASYLRALAAGARRAGLPAPRIMQSSGGLTDVRTASAHAALTVLSGPAGGVGGALLLARLAGECDVLFLDMGGTSCDVALALDGEVAETDRREVAGRPLALASLDIHTVGAGGGSIAWRDAGGALRVGPRSAGASPGPACYGRGGTEPTVTDANLVLGRLPAGTPLAGGLRLDVGAAHEAVGKLAQQLGLDVHACAEGIVRVAELEMLGALRVVSVRRGVDPRGLALLAFGGAGPLHAASLARQLGIARVLCPRASGVLSALGLAAAAPRRDAARSVLLSGAELSAERLEAERDELVGLARAQLDGDEAGGSIRILADMRYAGQSHELTVALDRDDGPAELREAFAAEHESRYGYRDEHAEAELVTLRVSAFGAAPALRIAREPGPDEARLRGPAVRSLGESTLFVPEGWTGETDEHGTIVLVDEEHAS